MNVFVRVLFVFVVLVAVFQLVLEHGAHHHSPSHARPREIALVLLEREPSPVGARSMEF